MIGYLHLELTDVDSFCNNINAFKSDVVANKNGEELYIKSLISLLTLDFSNEICVRIKSTNDYELKLFKEIIERYGGKIIENYWTKGWDYYTD